MLCFDSWEKIQPMSLKVSNREKVFATRQLHISEGRVHEHGSFYEWAELYFKGCIFQCYGGVSNKY